MTKPDGDEPPLVGETIARMILSIVPFGGAIDIMLADTRERLAYRVRQTVEEIVDVTGEDILAARLAESPEVEAVFVQGIEAATRTGYEAKRRLLSRVVTAAVLDDARVDEGLLVVLALRDLDAPHLRLLEAMSRAVAKVNAKSAALEPDTRGVGPSPTQRLDISITNQVKADTSDVPRIVVAGLYRAGALRPASTWDGVMGGTRPEHYRITGFGEAMLDHLREVGD